VDKRAVKIEHWANFIKGVGVLVSSQSENFLLTADSR